MWALQLHCGEAGPCELPSELSRLSPGKERKHPPPLLQGKGTMPNLGLSKPPLQSAAPGGRESSSEQRHSKARPKADSALGLQRPCPPECLGFPLGSFRQVPETDDGGAFKIIIFPVGSVSHFLHFKYFPPILEKHVCHGFQVSLHIGGTGATLTSKNTGCPITFPRWKDTASHLKTLSG